jgi:hypothetical protein
MEGVEGLLHTARRLLDAWKLCVVHEDMLAILDSLATLSEFARLVIVELCHSMSRSTSLATTLGKWI